MKHVFSISFEILGSHAQITEMKFTRAIGRTRVFLLAELPAELQKPSTCSDKPVGFLIWQHWPTNMYKPV